MASMLAYKGENDVFKIGEKLGVEIFAPTPPEYEVTLFIMIKDKNGDPIKNNKTISIKNGLASYTIVPKRIGKYYFVTSVSFKNLRTGEQEDCDNAFEYTVIN